MEITEIFSTAGRNDNIDDDRLTKVQHAGLTRTHTHDAHKHTHTNTLIHSAAISICKINNCGAVQKRPLAQY